MKLKGHYKCEGIGSLKYAYEKLLTALCNSGCTLVSFETDPGVFSSRVDYVVEGTKVDIETFKHS